MYLNRRRRRVQGVDAWLRLQESRRLARQVQHGVCGSREVYTRWQEEWRESKVERTLSIRRSCITNIRLRVSPLLRIATKVGRVGYARVLGLSCEGGGVRVETLSFAGELTDRAGSIVGVSHHRKTVYGRSKPGALLGLREDARDARGRAFRRG